MTTHTQEPWTSSGYEIRAEPEAGNFYTLVLRTVSPSGMGRKQAAQRLAADLRRIVACVNACAGISTEELVERARTREATR